jgi:hypothetical protein
MKFINNFIYQFPSTMFDPVLKIRVALTTDKEMQRREDGIMTIYYNPYIAADNLIVPLSDDELDFRKRFHAPDAPLITVKPFSDGEKKFTDVPYDWVVDGDVIRLKVLKLVDRFPYLVRGSQNEMPYIAHDISLVLLCIITNYINLRILREYCFDKVRYPHTNTIEICVTKCDWVGVFNMDQSDGVEVESGWIRVASRNLDLR